MAHYIHDPALYRSMSEPFATPTEAADAVEAFHLELRALREKHRIRDVVMVIAISALDANGEEGQSIAHASIGNSDCVERLLAYALGQERRVRDRLIAKLAGDI